MFNNVLHRNRTTDEPVVTERDADGDVVAERVTDTDSDGRIVNDEVHRTGTARRAGALDTAEQTGTFRTPVAERTIEERPVEPVTEPVTEPEVVERPRWAHSSVSAITGLVVGVVALGTTLTGLLAPLGVAVGIVGALVSLLGLLRASKRGVTGHGAAFIGLIASVAAIVLGVLAIQGELSWLNSNTDEVSQLHNWLNNTFPWMRDW